jgi:hypothetical protein
MSRGLKASCLLIGNMALFVDKSNILKREILYIVTFSVAHHDT